MLVFMYILQVSLLYNVSIVCRQKTQGQYSTVLVHTAEAKPLMMQRERSNRNN